MAAMAPGENESDRRRRALTLTEVTAVTAAALLLPAVMLARYAAILSQSKNNLRQIIIAFHNFASQNNGQLSDVYGADPGPNPATSLLPPFVEAPPIRPTRWRARKGAAVTRQTDVFSRTA